MTEDHRERELLARLGPAPGLCGSCRHRRLLESPRTVFVRCALAGEDSSLPRYPPLPVLRCHGYSADSASSQDRPGGTDPEPGSESTG